MLTDVLEKIMSIFAGKPDPEAKNRKIVRDLKKGLKKSTKFYNVKKDDVTSNLAQFFYNIYKIVGPFGDILINLESSSEIKNIIVESYMSEEQLKAVDKLSRESINKRLLASNNVKETVGVIHKEIISLVSSFSSELTTKINNTYSVMLMFKELACFNYYFLLKKFDSRLPNYDFVYKPSFVDIKASYVGDDLKDFLEVLAVFNTDSNWKIIFEIFNKYRDNLSIDMKSWNRVVKSLSEVKRSNALLHMAKVIDENPFYEAQARYSDISIVEDFINSIRVDAENTLKNVLRQKKESAMQKYIELIYGDSESVERNKYYTKHANITFEKKEMIGYRYVDPMNYLRAYYLDYFKTEAKPLIELLIIQGQWSTNVTSQEFSEAFHQIQEVLPKTIELDQSLADDAPAGSRIKTMLRKSGKDMIAKNALDSEIKTINAAAKTIVNNSISHLITIGNVIKAILEEYKGGKVGILINWKDLQNSQEEPLEEQLLKTYKKIFYMVQLLQQSSKDS